MKNKEKAIVVGAGLVGSLWSILLAKRGYEVAL
jgi:glycine/D-amino acid oxidase-like deaminating enzyme